jgi:hypothetical protein
MGRMKELFMQLEDFEREAEKDQLYLLEQLTEEAELNEPGPIQGEATIISHPKPKEHDKGPVEADYTLPF